MLSNLTEDTVLPWDNDWGMANENRLSHQLNIKIVP